MKWSYAQSVLRHGQRQRLIFLSGLALSLSTNVLLSIGLFLKSERVVVIPPELKEEVWLEQHRVSPSYLEETAIFMTHLLLDKSPGQQQAQDTILARHIAPAHYGQIVRMLLEEEDRRQQENLATHFVVTKVDVLPKSLQTQVTGELIGYINSERVTQTKQTYIFQFQLQRGKLWLTSFQTKGVS